MSIPIGGVPLANIAGATMYGQDDSIAVPDDPPAAESLSTSWRGALRDVQLSRQLRDVGRDATWMLSSCKTGRVLSARS